MTVGTRRRDESDERDYPAKIVGISSHAFRGCAALAMSIDKNVGKHIRAKATMKVSSGKCIREVAQRQGSCQGGCGRYRGARFMAAFPSDILGREHWRVAYSAEACNPRRRHWPHPPNLPPYEKRL